MTKSRPSRGISIFEWMRQLASKGGLNQLDMNDDQIITIQEILTNFEKDNQYTATEGERSIADIIIKEADFDHDGSMTVKELFQLIFGKDSQMSTSSSKGTKCIFSYVQCVGY